MLLKLLYFAVVSSAAEASAPGDHDDGFSRLVAWMKLHGGRVDQRIDVAEINGVRGVNALDNIEDGAELLYCPWKLVIGSTGLPDHMQMQSDDMCKVVQDMADEIRLNSDSLWWPYLEHIQNPRLTAMWEQSALDELQGLSPSEDSTRHIQWFSQICAGGGNNDSNGDLDQEVMRSLVSFVSRASEVGMVPIYDLLNHHNGKKNAKLTLTEAGVHLLVVGGPIQQGQEIYLSYGIKTAPTMYRDYAFVEEWPCFWNWKDSASGDNFAFVLFPDDVAAINPTKDFLKQIWSSSVPMRMRLATFQSSAKRHMESLPLEELEQFAQAARNHLDGFPTTIQQDQAILGGKREYLARALALIPGGTSSTKVGVLGTSHLEDAISAIEYRSTFKVALLNALNSSKAVAQAIRETLSSQEL